MSEAANPEIDRMKAAARALVPVLVARADEIETARQLPNDLARDLASQGLRKPSKALDSLSRAFLDKLLKLNLCSKVRPDKGLKHKIPDSPESSLRT